MENTTREEALEEVQVFLFSRALLKTLVAIYLLLWVFWGIQSTWLGNVGFILTYIFILGTMIYLLATPVLGVVYLVLRVSQKVNIRRGERFVPSHKERIGLIAACWIGVMVSSLFAIATAIGGEMAPHLECLRCIEGPDTFYARSGFERLLKRPVPEHVSGINFQSRNSILDEHQIVRFNTMNEEFIAGLIQDFELELYQRTRERDDVFRPRRPPYYTETYYLRPYWLYYNRETGDTKFEWLES